MRWAALPLLFAIGSALANPPAYTPAYGARYREPDDALLREILAELRALRAEVAALRGQAAEEKAPESLNALLGTRCAACHSAASAEQKGSGFVLLDAAGKVPPLSLAEKRRIVREIESGRMPKGQSPLSPKQKEALKKFLYPEDKP